MKNTQTGILGLVIAATLLFTAIPDEAEAQGTFIGTIQEGVVTASAQGKARRGSVARGAASLNVPIRAQVTSLTSQAELQSLRARHSMRGLVATLRTYNHGFVTVGGRTFPIHAAFVGQRGRIVILTTSGIGGVFGPARGAGGMAIGVVTLNPAASQGSVFVTRQAVGFQKGFPVARAGRSRIHAIRGLVRQ